MDCRSLFDGETTPWFWSSLNPSFREALIADTGLARYDVGHPLELAAELRTDRWQQLCDYLVAFPRLTPDIQVKVARLLNRMCFFRYTREVIPADIAALASQSESHAALSWLRAMAGYKLWLEGEAPDYRLEEFERIVDSAPPGLSRINALYQTVVQNVKNRNDLAATEHWQGLHAAAIEEVRTDLDPHDHLMAISRSHRVAGFIPQMRRDQAGTVREMDLAEEYARQMDFGTELQVEYAAEMMYPVLESRIKEALWIGDLDLALQRALRHRDADLMDARVWVHLGEVYVERDEPEQALASFLEAVRLSPPGGEVARFMAGQCHEYLEDFQAALDAYLGALRVDPLGVASAEGVLRVSEALGSQVHSWARTVVADLHELREQPASDDAGGTDAYRHLPPPVFEAAS